MAFLPVALAVAGTAVAGFSQFQQMRYQSAVAKNNAKIAGANAERASFASQTEQMRSDREYRANEGSLIASQAASGLDVLGVSQVASRSNLQRVRGEQAIDIRRQGETDVRNLLQEQANYMGEARAAKTQAWMGLAATAFNIGGTLAGDPAVKKGFHSLIGGSGSSSLSSSLASDSSSRLLTSKPFTAWNNPTAVNNEVWLKSRGL